MSATPQPEWLVIDEIAALLRVGPRCVRRLIREGELRAYAVGGRRQYVTTPAAIREYVERQVVVVKNEGRD